MDGFRKRFPVLVCCLIVCCFISGCGATRPDGPTLEHAIAVQTPPSAIVNNADSRIWKSGLERPAHVRFQGDLVRIDHVRDFHYRSEEDFDERYTSKTYNVNQVRTVDFVVVPFNNAPSLAHTMLSFGFENGEYIAVSVEARLQEGQKYNPLVGAFRQYELIYIIAEERDVIPLRTEHRDCDVYVYRTIAKPAQVKQLLLDVLQRAQQLEKFPESYDTLFNNCTTNIIRHVNVLFPGTIPVDIRAILPGMTDQLAFELGLLETDVSFAETRQQARVNERVARFLDSPDFSKKIRERPLNDGSPNP